MQIVLLGDSIAAGLGVAGCSYADKIEEILNVVPPTTRVISLAGTANQLSFSVTRLGEIIALQPEYVIIAHGITEAIVRPTPRALRHVPARWRQIGWLDPRPYFSRRLWKSIYHRTESALRWRVKVYLIKKYGGATLTSTEDFELLLTKAVTSLLAQTSATVILLTHSGIDDRFYPGSLVSLNSYRDSIVRVAANLAAERVQFCDVSELLNEWDDFFADHFHPNASGHRKIAEVLSDKVLLCKRKSSGT